MKRVTTSRWMRALAAGVVLGVLGAGSVRAEDLPSDPRVVTGELGNGLSYRVMQHAKPPGRVSLYMHISSGSLNETDKQRGIAHYLEHMAFNGSEHFPPGTVIDFFQAMGMNFGRDQNAFTSFDQTTYILSLPDNKPETLDQGLKFFADVNSRLLLLPDEIDKEREVILEERRTRLGGRQRVQDYMMKNLAPGSTFGERLPIGVEETIKGVTKQDFIDYWGTFYTPSNATVMVVGDMDPKVMAQRVDAAFGSLPKKPRPEDKPVGVREASEPRGVVAADKELTRADLAIQRITPPRPPTKTVAQFRADLVEGMAMGAFNRRIDDKIKAGKVSFQNGGAGTQNLADAIQIASVRFGGEPGKWREMLSEMAAEVSRARKYGFDADEIELVRKQIIAGAEQAVATEAGRDARTILGSMNESVASSEPMMSAQQSLDLFKRLAPTITPEECSKAFADAFKGSLQYTLSLPDSTPAPTEAELASLGEAAMNAEVKPEAKTARADKLMDTLPTPGKVAEGAMHEPSQVWSGWLANNVRVHHRFMDYRQNEASIVINLVGGELLETADNHGISEVAGLALSPRSAATKKLSSSQIRDLMTGMKVGVFGSGGPDGFRIVVAGNPEELETGLQLAYLLITEGKIEPAAFDQWKVRTLQRIESQDKDLDAHFGKLVAETIYSDVRLHPLTKQEVERLSVDAAQKWLEAQMRTNPIEVVVVGDVKQDKALSLVSRYLGALPSRERISSSSFAAQRRLAAPAGKKKHDEMESSTDKAQVLVSFFGPDESAVAEQRAMRLAGRILSTRMLKKIREEESLVYSISAAYTPGTLYPGYGMMTARSSTDPHKVPALVARCNDMIAEFARTGCTTEELEIAKKQILNTLDEQMKLPQFWLGNMDGITFRGRNVQDVLDAPEAYKAFTPEQILATYKKYCKPDQMVEITLAPKAAAAGH